jgi:peptidoglycan/xylan/chitin deacetylase (PgdA/CDA1 family)
MNGAGQEWLMNFDQYTSRVPFLVPICICLGLLFFPMRSVSAQEVAITFDDLPTHGPLPNGTTRTEIARRILATLQDAKAPEVYGFVNAERLEKNPADIEVLKLWREAGQPLGNHTYSHMNFNENSVASFQNDIEKNEQTLKLLMGANDWHWFRYPYLWEGDTPEKRHAARSYLKEHGYHIAQVTMDFEDYAWNGPYARCVEKKDEKAIAWLKDAYLNTAREYIALDQKMAKQIFGRDIKHVLLLHIGAFDALMLPQLLEQLKQQGFKFVTIQQAEADPAYETDPDAALKYGGTLLDQIFDSRHLEYPPHTEKPMKELQAICQ